MNADTKKRIAELRNQLRANPALQCAKCHTNIHGGGAITGKYETKYGVLCRRCFSEYLGEEIEKHPLKAAPLEKNI